jgi:acyl carrier protein phosphodiesterase
MNFLGHLFFSYNNYELMTANLFGDFVKGSDLSAYSDIQEKGIRLHREIDHYMDHHPAVVEVMQELYASLPKVTGIAMDLYFDHLLAMKWEEYHDIDFNTFLNNYYRSIDEVKDQYPDQFLIFLQRLRSKNWMHYYQLEYGLDKACNGVSRRISFPNTLINGLQVFKANEKIIRSSFDKYMIEATKHFSDWHKGYQRK